MAYKPGLEATGRPALLTSVHRPPEMIANTSGWQEYLLIIPQRLHCIDLLYKNY